MYLDNKGFASAELILVTLIVIIMIGGIVTMINGEMDKTQTGSVGEARMMGEKIAEAVNTVYINGNGYSIYLDTSQENDLVFTADLNSTGYVTVFYGGQQIHIKMVPKNITDFTMVNNKRYQIKNVNGTVNINDVS
ncbi:MAG: hypothetical protein K8E24_005880 [Methanobacterium paludis]|nr:hypothetical protein [Methanobacterium paludis]